MQASSPASEARIDGARTRRRAARRNTIWQGSQLCGSTCASAAQASGRGAAHARRAFQAKRGGVQPQGSQCKAQVCGSCSAMRRTRAAAATGGPQADLKLT